MAAGQLDSSVGFIVQARMASSRLPGKVLMPMPLGSRETILSQIGNTLQTFGARLIIATSLNTENDAIEDYCLSNGFTCFRGDENDVLSRFYQVQKEHSFEHIFRFTADNPLIDKAKLQEFYQKYLAQNLDYAYSQGMPLGMNFEVFKGSILERLPLADLNKSDKEHVTLFFRAHKKYKKATLNLANLAECRMTVDTPLDYAQLSLIFQIQQMCGATGLTLVEVVREKYPWLLTLNQGVLQNNSTTSTEKEIEALASFAIKLGYTAAAKKLLD